MLLKKKSTILRSAQEFNIATSFLKSLLFASPEMLNLIHVSQGLNFNLQPSHMGICGHRSILHLQTCSRL